MAVYDPRQPASNYNFKDPNRTPGDPPPGSHWEWGGQNPDGSIIGWQLTPNYAVGPAGTGTGAAGTPASEQPVMSPGAGGTIYDPTARSDNPDAQLRFSEQAYRKGIGDAGYDFNKFGGQALKNRFEPTASNFRWNSLLNAGQGQPGSTDFEGYSRTNAGGGRNIYNRAQELFNTIVGGGAQIGREGLYNNAIYAGTGEETGLVGDEGSATAAEIRAQLLDLARTASRGKWGGWSGGGPSNQSIYDEFNKMAYAGSSAAEAGGSQGAGIDWSAILKRRLGI